MTDCLTCQPDVPRAIVQLQQALRESVPIDVLQRFAPELSYGRHFGPPAWDARQAAVTILLYWHQETWFVPLTLRPESLAMHAGQVSFPGGRLELEETSEQCAIREWHEELGAPQVDFYWAGELKPIYVFHSNYVIAPHLMLAPRRPQFHPDAREVASVLEVPLLNLFDAAHHGEHQIVRGGVIFKAPHFSFNGLAIWGATAILLSQLVWVARRALLEDMNEEE